MKAAITMHIVQAQQATMNLCTPNFHWLQQVVVAEVRHVASQERSDVREKDKADAG
jgi:hypothetical protein